MKLAFVEPHLGIYGGIRRVVELSSRLADRGHDVTIFHPEGSPCQWLPCSAKVKPHDEVLNDDYDVVIYNDPNPIDYELVRAAEARLKVFYVLALYDRHLLKGVNPRILMRPNSRMSILKRSLHAPYLKLANSTWIQCWLKENLHIGSRLLIGGVNTVTFHPAESAKRPDEIRILCSGDPRERKGTATIRRAVEIVKGQRPTVILDTYHGKGIPQTQMAGIYSSADLFADAQWHAGWNNPVAEAMACEVPVVCTDIGGVKDFAFHEQTALLVPREDPTAMASGLLRLMDDPHLRERLRKSAYEHISQFDWDRSTTRMEKILESELRRTRMRVALRAGKKLRSGLRRIAAGGGHRFDKYAKWGSYHWDAYYGNDDHLYKKHVDYVVNGLKGQGTLLDIGCGDGLIASLLSESGFAVKGIDIDRIAIRLAREKCPHVDFEVRDVFATDEQFDYVLASEVIEHLPNPEQFLEKLKALFTKQALVTTPRRDYYKDLSRYHYREYSFHEFRQLIGLHFRCFRIESSKHHLYAWIEE